MSSDTTQPFAVFETLLNQSDVVCLTFKPEAPYPIDYCLDGFYHLVKRDKQPLTMSDVIHPDDWPAYQDELSDYLAQPDLTQFERTPFRLHGDDLHASTWIQEKGLIQRHNDLTAHTVYLMWEDVTLAHTEAKQNEQEQKQFEYLLETLNIGYFEYLLGTEKVHYSNTWKKQLGYEPLEIESHLNEWKKRVDGDYIERIYDQIDAHLRGETEWFEAIFPMRHKLGHKVWTLAKGKAQRDENGVPISITATHTDLTLVKQRSDHPESSLSFGLDSDSLLQQIFMKAPTALVIYNLDANTYIANPAMIDLLGYHPAELSGKLYTQLIHPEDRLGSIEFIDKLAKKEIPDFTPAIRRVFHRDGYICHLEFRSFITTLENGDKILCSLVEDITQSVRQQNATQAIDDLLDQVQ